MNRMLDFTDLQNMLNNNFLYFYEPYQTNFANFCYFPVDLHLNLQYKFRCKFCNFSISSVVHNRINALSE